MPLFEHRDPDLPSLIAYLVARSLERGVTLNQTKLVKLLYLIDVERIASRREPLTGLCWVFFHYGPYALELPETLEWIDGTRVITAGYRDSVLYRGAPDAPDGQDWPPATRRQVDEVIRRYASLELNELLDHVYFHTSPMRDAARGQPLDMDRARTEPPRRPEPALAPPAVDEQARERLDAWRERRSRTLRPVQGAQTGAFFADPDSETVGREGQSGRIVVEEH